MGIDSGPPVLSDNLVYHPRTYYLVFEEDTGRIVQTGWCPVKDLSMQERPGCAVLRLEADATRQYVSNGQVLDRPQLPQFDKLSITADGTDEASVTGLPDPCSVKINGQTYEVTGGSLSISSELPRRFRVEIEHWPHVTYQCEVVAS